MKIEFIPTMSLLECFEKALNHINHCKQNKSKAVLMLNKSAYINRIVDHALMNYLKANYKKLDVIECEYRSYHYGVPIGTVLKHDISITDISVQKQAEILKRARIISQSIDQSKYL